ncbi:MAG: beta-phosphoglucomutase family hydrolase [Candidatus Omnitrophota bacterium]|nr:beta-phosphoglucomutase family hydrolase [Candidatus Omnitrophota bacterium]
MPLKGVIFDMDGVVVNTVPLHFKAWKKMFSGYGKKFTFKDYELKVDGIPRINGARAILPELSEEELEKAASKKQKLLLEFLRKDGVKAYRDAVYLIKDLKKNKIKRAIITSSKNCLYILKRAKINGLFDVIITGNEIKKGKPHPDIFLLAAKRLGLKARECVVIEDAFLGIIAAKRAKMKAVGIDRYGKPARLKEADLIVNNLKKSPLSKLERLFFR